MFVLPLWSFHLGFASGVPWSWAAEAATLAAYLVWVIAWDFLWFLLNPRFGWNHFLPSEVWWHRRPWPARFPMDYWSGLFTSLALAATARLSSGGFQVLTAQGAMVAGFIVLTLISAAAAPAYMRWHGHMRRPGSDERELVLPRGGDAPQKPA